MSIVQLPALAIEAKAELITNNLPEFEKVFRANLDAYKFELVEDDDSKKAKDDIKAIKAAEDNLKTVDQAIVDGSVDIKELRESIATLASEARTFRLSREKEVKIRDKELKEKIFEKGYAIIDHPNKYTFSSNLDDAAKGKRSLTSMEKAVLNEAEQINAKIQVTRTRLDEFVTAHSALLVPDRSDLELKEISLVETELTNRLQKQADEKEKAELRAKAEAAEKELEAAKIEPALTASEPLPEPPKIDSIPVKNSPEPLTQEQEMEQYLAKVVDIFKPMKPAREALTHPANQDHALEFATAINEAYKTLKGRAE